VKQVVGTRDSPHTRDDDAKKPSSVVVRKIQSRPQPSHIKTKRAYSSLLKRVGVGRPPPWKLPAKLWPEKPSTVYSRRRALNLRGLPLATTIKDIVLSIDNAAREHKGVRRASLTADIVIRPGSDSSKEVDAVVDFLHPDGAQVFRDLAVQGKFKVCGVVPEVSMDYPRDPSKIPQPSGGDDIIAQLSKLDRAEYFSSPELRKIVRRTHLIYN
jgi:hypothetical protein